MKSIDVIVAILLVIGGLNWGLMGFFDLNFLGMVFGYGSAFTRLIYCLIGVSALYQIFQWKAIQSRWKK